MSFPAKSANRLLSAISSNTYKAVSAYLEPFELTYKAKIFEVGEEIKHVYFPETGIISLLTAVEERSTLEVGIVGKDGLAGLSLFLGKKFSSTQAIVQGPGNALRMSASRFLKECSRSDELPKALRGFTHSLLVQISQSAVCNRFHSVDARLARWLLMTADRMEADKFAITQDFLSKMLGVRREAVSGSAAQLQKDGIISYQRGNVRLHDRGRLEAASCVCYRIISGQVSQN